VVGELLVGLEVIGAAVVGLAVDEGHFR